MPEGQQLEIALGLLAGESAEEILQQFQQLNDDLNSNDLGRQAGATLSLLIIAATIRAGRGEGEVPKPVNLPSWRRVDVVMDYIATGHMEGGLPVSDTKTVFPSYLRLPSTSSLASRY